MLKPGQIIQQIIINDQNYTFRLPKMEDCKKMLNFVNELSRERTYIQFQGKQLTLADEKQYLKSIITQIKNNKALVIIITHNNKIIGAADIKMQQLTEKHIGVFGIMIREEYRNQGLGSKLMQILFNKAQKHLSQLETIILYVFAQNKKALHIYKNKYGFKQYGFLPNGYKLEKGYADRILMYLNIKK